MKGSVLVYDDETLAFWERSKRTALENISENPRVVVFYRKPQERTVRPELDRDPDRKGVAVLIEIDLIDELSGNVLQRWD